jgi:hypothetical protein
MVLTPPHIPLPQGPPEEDEEEDDDDDSVGLGAETPEISPEVLDEVCPDDVELFAAAELAAFNLSYSEAS